MTQMPEGWHDGTLVVHGLPEPDQWHAHLPPIYQTTTFTTDSIEQGARIAAGSEPGYLYSRVGNPTLTGLERTVAALEHAAGGISFSSGMGAVSAAFMAALKAGDRVLIQDVHYGSTQAFCNTILPQIGVEVVVGDLTQLEAVEAVLKAKPTAMVYIETPANPTLKLCDIAALTELAHRYHAVVAVDSTFPSPLLTRPLEYGVDLVVHASTKHFSGHGWALGGIVLYADAARWHPPLFHMRAMYGAVPSPFDAWLIQLGLKTLHLRFERACQNALAIAHFLQEHPQVAGVHYPGLPDNPQYALCQKQMRGIGGTMVSFDIQGGAEAAKSFCNATKLFALTASLGYVDSLVQYPAAMTHGMLPVKQRRAMGIGDGLLRLSIGVEDEADLLGDLDQALAVVKNGRID